MSGLRDPHEGIVDLGAGSQSVGLTPKRKFPKHLVEIYDIETGSPIGQGAFSTVWKCRHRATAQVRAIKRIDTMELPAREIAHEIAWMKLLSHDNVVKCYDVFLEAHFVNIVVDMFSGGDLVDGLNAHRRDRGRLPDRVLANLVRQMVAAISHVHSISVVHRDVKGENFLLDRPDVGDLGCRIALTDFGTACRLEPGQSRSERVGTPAFWSPEVLQGRYSFPVDIWAIGVTTYILAMGSVPFKGEEEILAPTVAGKPSYPPASHTSPLCAEFMSKCMAKDVASRPTASELARHPWIRGLGDGKQPGSESVTSGGSPQVPALFTWELVGDILEGLVVGVCTSLGCCLEFLMGPPPKAQSKKAQAPSSSSIRPPPKDGVEREVDLKSCLDQMEKQVTDLARRMTANKEASIRLHL